MQRSSNLGAISPNLSGLTRNVLIGSVALYVLQLLGESWAALPVLDALSWWPFASDRFQPWQPLSAFLLNGPDPLAAFFSWLAIFFFLPSIEQSFGRRGVASATATTLGFTIALGLLLQLVGAIAATGPAWGPGALLTALTVLFGFSRPNATILLFFILPVRAIWIAWGTGLLAALYFLASRTLGSALILSGWIGAWLWLQGVSPGSLRTLWLRWRHARLHRRLRKLEVIEGGRGKADRDGDSGPIYH